MNRYRIAAIPADGIGPEVIAAGLQALAALERRDGGFALEATEFDWGSDRYRRTGALMPEDGPQQLKAFDAIFFGAVGAPDVPDHLTLWGLRLPICQGLDQYANVHADILSDLAGALAGSLGVAPTGNIDPERRFPSMFEPIHGSAFDITGKGIANPVATFWTAAQMLDHLGEPQAAARLMRAVEAICAAGIATPDIGGTATTGEVTEAVCDAIRGANV
ncbi:hypothetical protein GE300_07565 [Rhodobacteraceae bacterium 2CG4]|uniref:Isopropylmalate dehydrogenase-like domain-containing protein n=1 Tax=Halovulum marinum TaxID=2662447 RepID=A0A6L5Z033_9RHOB|nr:isocitrate/isopropylmalate family dehydrogenase [Halovulum marinum]MSU89472.1 hypothetical protein [Halovulum marinum]